MTSDTRAAWAVLFFSFGPGEPSGRFVPTVASHLLGGRRVPLTMGDHIRDYQHVNRTGLGLAQLAASNLCGRVNVASGTGTRVRDLAVALARCGGHDERLLGFGEIETAGNESGSVVADVALMRSRLSCDPPDILADVAQVMNWWEEHYESASGDQHREHRE